MTCYATYRNLTLEFLSSLIYFPTHGFALRRGLIIFRLFGITFKFNHKELGELLGFPNGIGVYHETQEECLGFRELDYFGDLFLESLTLSPRTLYQRISTTRPSGISIRFWRTPFLENPRMSLLFLKMSCLSCIVHLKTVR